MRSRQCYRAVWVFLVDRPPIENGFVEIVDGRLTAVRAARRGDQATDLGDVAIVPGLVNAHTHLEFSLVERPFEPARPFADWIRSLVTYRRQTLDGDAPMKLAALQAGLREAAQSGTTLLGEIATGDWPAAAIDGIGPRVVRFWEVIGLPAEVFDRQERLAREWLERSNHAPSDEPSVSPDADPLYLVTPKLARLVTRSDDGYVGLSPHAPYSVAPRLLQRLVHLAKRFDAPLAMHVAETQSELELLSSGTGELAEMLQAFGAWPDGGFAVAQRPLDTLRILAESPRVLVVHGNYLADDELDFVAAHPNLSVVYCPRTHEYFGHEPHPWRQLLARGANVAIGTDGRGSNPDLSLWNELVFLRTRFADVSPRTLLELGTLSGARALGLDAECGSLTVGKRADLAIVSLDGQTIGDDPHEYLFVSEGQVCVL